MSNHPDDLDRRIDAGFSVLAFIVNRHLIEHMRRIAMALDMDFELAYLYGVLAHLNVAPLIVPGEAPRNLLDEITRGAHPDLVAQRLTDVAQVSGLPRETVRRKLEQLQTRGKAERTPEGLWKITFSGVDAHTRHFTKETIQRFLKTASELQQTLNQAKPSIDPQSN